MLYDMKTYITARYHVLGSKAVFKWEGSGVEVEGSKGDKEITGGSKQGYYQF